MARLLLDTNVIIRFLTGDHLTHSPRSRNLFVRAAEGEVTLVLTDLALAETAWVLESFYSLDRAEITAALKGIVESTGIEVQDKRILLSALQNFGQTGVNFVDAVPRCCSQRGIHCHRVVRSRLRLIPQYQAHRASEFTLDMNLPRNRFSRIIDR